MNHYPWIHEELMAKPGATRDFKEEWNWIRYQVGGKLYAAVCRNEANEDMLLTLKLEPLEGELLRRQYADIIPGYYMNKVHWNSIKLDGTIPDDLIRHMMEESYRLIVKSLPQKVQKELNLM